MQFPTCAWCGNKFIYEKNQNERFCKDAHRRKAHELRRHVEDMETPGVPSPHLKDMLNTLVP